MEKLTKKSESSRYNTSYDDLEDDFVFPSDEEIEFETKQKEKSPKRTLAQQVLIEAVMAALTTATAKDQMLVTTIARSMITGATATLAKTGVGGFPGVAVGALVAGGVYAYRSLKNKSAMEILRSLSPQQQRQLMLRLARGLRGLDVKDLAFDILFRGDVKDAALNILSHYLAETFGVKLMRKK